MIRNPFGVGLVVGLGFWSLLLQKSQVRFPLVPISVGPYRACSGFKWAPRKWTVGLIPRISRFLDRIPSFFKKKYRIEDYF